MITNHASLGICRCRAKGNDIGESNLRVSFNQQSVRSVFKISFHAFDFFVISFTCPIWDTFSISYVFDFFA